MIRKLWYRFFGSRSSRSDLSRPYYTDDKFGDDSSSVSADYTLGVVNFGELSICGNVREHNEDSLYTTDSMLDFPLFVVADGMGGQLGGEHASRMAVEIIPREIKNRFSSDIRTTNTVRAIREAVGHANHEILAASLIRPQLSNMGTTVVLLFVHKGRAFVAGIGDSRCYRIRSGRMELLTRDHSMAQALAEVGTIRQEDVATHRYNHVLYLYLGSREVDRGTTDVKVLSLLEGDCFMLCSDGLSGVLSEKEMISIIKAEPDAQKAAEKLVEQALANRSRDNITCIVVKIGKKSDVVIPSKFTENIESNPAASSSIE